MAKVAGMAGTFLHLSVDTRSFLLKPGETGQQFGLTGLLAIDEKKLLQMPDDKALRLFLSGELSWIYCQLMSLGNMGKMVDRIAARVGASAE